MYRFASLLLESVRYCGTPGVPNYLVTSFVLQERVSISTTAPCHLAGFLLAFQSTPPLLMFHFCSKARRVHYIHRRVLRWCKGIIIFARSCCIASVCLV